MYRTILGYGLADNATDSLVEPEHIKEDAAELREVETADRSARRNIRFQDIRENFNVVVDRKDIEILGSLSHKRVPLNRGSTDSNARLITTYSIIRKFHEFRNQFFLLGFVWLSGNHVANCLVECMHLGSNEVSRTEM